MLQAIAPLDCIGGFTRDIVAACLGYFPEDSEETTAWVTGVFLVQVQAFMSGLASVYNEKLLKENKSIHQANAQLYATSENEAIVVVHAC